MLCVVILVDGCGDQKSSPEGPQAEAPKGAAVQDDFASVTNKIDVPMLGSIDGVNDVTAPKAHSTVVIQTDKITISGFAVDPVNEDLAAGVVVMIGEKFFVAIYGGDRPDIAKALNNPKYVKSQFYVEVPKALIGKGIHELKIRVIANNRSGYYASTEPVNLDVK